MPAPSEHTTYSYHVDLWDVLGLIANIPKHTGQSVYSKSYRSAMNETFNHFYRMAGETEETGESCPINKGLVLNWLKSNIMFHVHQCDAAQRGSEEKVKAQAQIDAYSVVYDLIHGKL